MYGSSDEVYVEAMTEDIRNAVMLLASQAEVRVPEKGLFEKVKVAFEDKSGKLDITRWGLAVCSIGNFDGADVDKRYIDLYGLLNGGARMSTLIFCGSKAQCIETLRHPDYVEKIKSSIRNSLFWMDD